MQQREQPIPKKQQPSSKNERDKNDDIVNVREIGGVKGPEPTRYGDWEKNGRCIDF